MKTLNQEQLLNTEFSVFKAPIANIKISAKRTLIQIYNAIKGDALKEQTLKVRNGDLKLKTKLLPYFTPAGVFSTRNDNSIIEHSNIICIDIDDLDDDLTLVKSKINSLIDHVIMSFISPSGSGLKVFLPIDNTSNISYKDWYTGIRYYLSETCDIDIKKIDRSCSNISRPCLICQDTDAFLNPSNSVTPIDISLYLNKEQTVIIPQSPKFVDYQIDNNITHSENCFLNNLKETEKEKGLYGQARLIWILSLAGRCINSGLNSDECIYYTRKHLEFHPESTRINDPIDVNKHIIFTINDAYKRYPNETNSPQRKNKEVKFIGSKNHVRSANQRVRDAENLPEIQKLFGEFWQTGELSLFFGDTGLGKSIFVTSIANALSKGEKFLDLDNDMPPQKTLLYDFELSDQQFRKRSTSKDKSSTYQFSDMFEIVTLDMRELSIDNPTMTMSDIIHAQMQADIKEFNAKIIIVDNITYLTAESTQKGDVAREIMLNLLSLKNEFNISILVVAHTPKIPRTEGININHLAGSKQFANLADNTFSMGRSVNDDSLKYIKHIKGSRSAEIVHGVSNVLLCQITNSDNFVTFEHLGFGCESTYLSTKEQNKEALTKEIIKLHGEGKHLREIGSILNLSKSTVGRILQEGQKVEIQ